MNKEKHPRPFFEKLFIVICCILMATTIVGYSYMHIIDEQAESIYEVAVEQYDSNYSDSLKSTIISTKGKMILKPKKFIRAFLYGLYDEINENYDEAREHYTIAINDEKADDEHKAFAYFKISQLYFNELNYNDALDSINSAIILDDTKSFYYLYRSEYLLQLGQYDLALADVKNYEQDSTLTTDQLSSVITIYLMVKDYDGAIEYINKAMTYENVDQNNLLLYRCQTYILNEKYEEALKDAQTYADNVGSDVRLIFAENLQACELYQAAVEYYYLYLVDNYETADMSVYESAMECAYDGDNYDALLVFSATALEYAKEEEDIANCNKWYGIALMQEGYYEDAIESLDVYLAYSPEHFDIYYLRGLCSFIIGEYEDAVNDFTLVINSDTMVEDSLYNRALCYSQIEEEEKCIADLKKLIEIGTDESLLASANELLATFEESTES